MVSHHCALSREEIMHSVLGCFIVTINSKIVKCDETILQLLFETLIYLVKSFLHELKIPFYFLINGQ